PVPTMRRWRAAVAWAPTTRTTTRLPCSAVAKHHAACRPWKARAWTIWTFRRSCAARPTETSLARPDPLACLRRPGGGGLFSHVVREEQTFSRVESTKAVHADHAPLFYWDPA